MYTIERCTQTNRFGEVESFYVIVTDRLVVDEYETIEAAREAVRWLPIRNRPFYHVVH